MAAGKYVYNLLVGGQSVGMTFHRLEAEGWAARGPVVLINGGKAFAEAGNSRPLERRVVAAPYRAA